MQDSDVHILDDVDRRVLARLESLEKRTPAPSGTFARVLRLYPKLEHANKILNWPYKDLAEILKDEGTLITANTLRIYMQRIRHMLEKDKPRAPTRNSGRGSRPLPPGIGKPNGEPYELLASDDTAKEPGKVHRNF